MGSPKKLVAGNWKMNGTKASLVELRAIGAGAGSLSSMVDLAVCPPATLATAAAEALGLDCALGGQDCHWEISGAFTGDVSAEMWADLGAAFVIVGHSERRAMHGETDAIVKAKANAALRAGLTPIVCVGETLEQRDAGRTLAIVSGQVANSLPGDRIGPRVVLAYEPVWAIGTGRTPTTEQVAEVHRAIRSQLRDLAGQAADQVRLLYGGSVKPANAKELMHAGDVDGALVGGASLKAADFLAIATACA